MLGFFIKKNTDDPLHIIAQLSAIHTQFCYALFCYGYVICPCVTDGIKNGFPCIVEIRGTQGCALVGYPARAAGECRDVAVAQP